MNLTFYKYQGAGNDFIVLDNRNRDLSSVLTPVLIRKMCDRHFGIGADGLMALQLKEGYDFEMLYFNADGNSGTMCGNGGRCIVAFAEMIGQIHGETNFLAVDGPHYAKISEEGRWISLKMIDVNAIRPDGTAWVLDTGSPHFVQQVTNLESLNVFTAGRTIRYNDRYSEKGVNVNYVEDMGDTYYVRTYERGVEDETYACGTGVTAVAMTMAKIKKKLGHVTTIVQTRGGRLNVKFTYDGKNFTDVFLEGPAEYVFQGSFQAT